MTDQTSWQDTVTAVGTLLAVIVSVGLAVFEGRRARRAERELRESKRVGSAQLVSGWIEDSYLPNADGSAYLRSTTLHLSNDSNEPVFRVTVSVGVGFETVAIGPLSVPVPLPVLPAGRAQSWPITTGLLARSITDFPVVEIGFTDAAGRRWLRKFDGTLIETTGKKAVILNASPESADLAVEQLGPLDTVANPMAVAINFINVVRSEELDPEFLRAAVAPEAGWDPVGDIDLLRASIEGTGLASFVHYPAPQVAYIKLPPDRASNQVVQGGDAVDITARVLTLTFTAAYGWRIFSVGKPVPPIYVTFAPGQLEPGL